MLPCPICGAAFPDVGQMAAHVAVVHLVAPSEAMRQAREVREMSTPKEATPMQNETDTCSKCGTKGHNARSPECPAKGKPTPVTKACSYCKHTDHTFADCPMAQARREGKRKPVTRKAPKARASANGFAGALSALRAERQELDAAIAALERLEARGR